ncbi:NAD(P)/FAD-dependent oxidoreductase [Nonomuraea sp. SYSU D8015]|uniref:NAD(P)/FAD-dependent oxidoreductase n=1 Tax=Nonomuraea sp. SYSU D8015 TaxID=2593644 RepID=UPI0016609E35|nr:FAD-dependent oxidoreductase [Nonomuraea sp. SYSU D8015]
MNLLIVGAGQAGVQLAGSARDLGWEGPITLVGQEPHAPYARPPLSKAFLKGEAPLASLALRSAAFYADKRIDLVTGEHIDRIDLAGDGTGMATSATGHRWRFDRLVLATGARPRRLPIEGAGLDGVLSLRDVRDAQALAGRLATATAVVVIGGGFIGLEVAATTAAAGIPATVVEAAPALMNRVVSTATADIVATAHRTAGIQVRTGLRPVRLRGTDGAVAAVELDDGEELPADLVVVGVGAQPRDELARAAGLRCDDGIVVDARSLASDGHTIAIGDCANLPDPSPWSHDAPRLRLESVDNAVEQATSAAATLAGLDRPYRGVPWFWSDQGKLKLQIAGLARPDDEIVLRPGRRPGQHTALRYRGAQLVAAECVNSPADFLAMRRALSEGISLPRTTATDTDMSLKEHFAIARSADLKESQCP